MLTWHRDAPMRSSQGESQIEHWTARDPSGYLVHEFDVNVTFGKPIDILSLKLDVLDDLRAKVEGILYFGYEVQLYKDEIITNQEAIWMETREARPHGTGQTTNWQSSAIMIPASGAAYWGQHKHNCGYPYSAWDFYESDSEHDCNYSKLSWNNWEGVVPGTTLWWVRF